MTSEFAEALFDPDEIQTQLDRDLAAGLRMVAAALEQGQLEGKLVRAQGVGGSRGDQRIHVLVSIDLAAPALAWHKETRRAELPEKVGE